MCGSIRDVLDARVGDTITLSSEYKAAASKVAQEKISEEEESPIKPLPGYAESVPMVFCGVFPVDADDYEKLRDALGKMRLNDAAISYEPETSGAMGFGFRCGFLGLLHMEIVQERLQREYDVALIVTAPRAISPTVPAVTPCVWQTVLFSGTIRQVGEQDVFLANFQSTN